MTDITKYKSVALSHSSAQTLDKIRRIILPGAIVSRAKTLDMLLNEKSTKLTGTLKTT